MKFPEGFVWGTATASYQIEGAVHEDGRRVSIWDTFSRTPGKVHDGHTGGAACDHYHRYADDVALMHRLGLAAYRFSIAWPRVRPDGTGAFNQHGLDFYDRLTDALLAADIAPYATLYHWDLPQPLEDAGGWANRDTAGAFAEFAAAVAERLGDRVAAWMPVNEPWVAAFLGYAAGIHAPGRADPKAAFQAAHHLLLAHGLAATELRTRSTGQVGAVLNLSPVYGEEGRATRLIDGLLNRQFLDPVLRGHYPDDVLHVVNRHAGLGHIHDGDLDIIAQPVDFVGVNYYQPTYVSDVPGAAPNPAFPGSDDVAFSNPEGVATTAMDWPIVPSGLTDLLQRLSHDYPGTPLVITENGAAFDDRTHIPPPPSTPTRSPQPPTPPASVADPDRVAYLDEHVRAVHAAITAGVDVQGFFVWSLLDNFEWAEGYRRRFGIVAVDFDTQRRIPKDSAQWFASVIRRNGLEDE